MSDLLVDSAEIGRAVRILFGANEVMEVRIPKTRFGVVSGYFDNHALMVKEILRADRQHRPSGVYWVLNKLDPALLGRAYNRLVERAEHTTADNNILRRRWLPVDLDPVRPAGVSSSEEEKDLALRRAGAVAAEMAREFGQPILGDSGNGAHLLYPIDLPNDEESLALVSGALAELDRRYSDEHVKVDVTCANAARIWKVYGTVARKGDSIPGRPHRLSKILEVLSDQS